MKSCITKWGITQDGTIKLGIVLSTIIARVTEPGVTTELFDWVRNHTLGIALSAIIARVTKPGLTMELCDWVRNHAFTIYH